MFPLVHYLHDSGDRPHRARAGQPQLEACRGGQEEKDHQENQRDIAINCVAQA